MKSAPSLREKALRCKSARDHFRLRNNDQIGDRDSNWLESVNEMAFRIRNTVRNSFGFDVSIFLIESSTLGARNAVNNIGSQLYATFQFRPPHHGMADEREHRLESIFISYAQEGRSRKTGVSGEEMRLSCVLMNKATQGVVNAHRHVAVCPPACGSCKDVSWNEEVIFGLFGPPVLRT